jgi:hypothetical protein
VSTAERERIRAMCRLLVHEGHLTPWGQRELTRLTDEMTDRNEEPT